MTRKLELLRTLQTMPEASAIWRAIAPVVDDYHRWQQLERRFADGLDNSPDARRLMELRRTFDIDTLTIAA